MTTHERELTEPVDLCTGGGRRLNPAARGWSRLPLHRANLGGRWGRTKRWDYWAILAGDLVVACTFADLDYLGTVDVWWADLATSRTGGRSAMLPGARGIALPDRPGSVPLRFDGRDLRLEIADDAGGTNLSATWKEKDGSPSRLEARIDLPPGHESLNVVIPWSDTTFQYTSKHQARPARGELAIGGDVRRFGDDGDAFGVLDVGRGRWPYRSRWNWGGGAGRAAGGKRIGLQLGGKWTLGTGFTENGVIVDGRLTKIGEELTWSYDWRRPTAPWRVTAKGGAVDLVLAPRYDKHTRVEAGLIGTEVHQLFGRWSGTVTTDEGERLSFDDLQGFAEEARWRW